MKKGKQRLLRDWKYLFKIVMWSWCKYKNNSKSHTYDRDYTLLHLTTACKSYNKLQKIKYSLGW